MGARYCNVCNTHCTGSDIFVFEKTYCPQCVEPVIEKMEEELKYYKDKENNKQEELLWTTFPSLYTVIIQSKIGDWIFTIVKTQNNNGYNLEIKNENNDLHEYGSFNIVREAISEANKVASFLGLIK